MSIRLTVQLQIPDRSIAAQMAYNPVQQLFLHFKKTCFFAPSIVLFYSFQSILGNDQI